MKYLKEEVSIKKTNGVRVLQSIIFSIIYTTAFCLFIVKCNDGIVAILNMFKNENISVLKLIFLFLPSILIINLMIVLFIIELNKAKTGKTKEN